MTPARTILHVDMDAFFASIEQLDDPNLRGRPVLVGYDGPRGVVAAASYEARVFGCHSAQPMSVAKRHCPQAAIVPVRFARYHDVSRQMFSILDHFSPVVEPLSVDEAFIDLTGTERLLGPAEEVGRQIKNRVRSELSLTASIGIAPNKFLAKLASDLKKPDGLVVIAPEQIDQILMPLPVGKLWGIGAVTGKKLASAGIRTIADLRNAPPSTLDRLLGNHAEWFLRLAQGLDDRPVVSDRQAKSIGQEQTFTTNLENPSDVRPVLFQQVEHVGRRLRRHGLAASTVTLKLRYGDFETITRSITLAEPTDLSPQLWNAAEGLFTAWCRLSFQPLRLIGVGASQLTVGQGQLQLFEDPQHQRLKQLDAVADRIATKFGKNAIRRASGLE